MRRACEITVAAHRAVFQSLKAGMTQGRGGGPVGGGPPAPGRARAARSCSSATTPRSPTAPRSPQPLKAGRRRADRRRLPAARLLERHHAHRGLRRAAHRPPAQGLGHRAPGPGGGLPRRQAGGRSARPWTPPRARWSRTRASAPTTSTFTHRLGHGIGMDGHEWTYFVRGNTTTLRARHVLQRRARDLHLRRDRASATRTSSSSRRERRENMTKWTGTPEEPAVV